MLSAVHSRGVDAFLVRRRVRSCNGKRLQALISLLQPAETARLPQCASSIETIAPQQLSTISKTGTVVDVLDIYGLFHAVTFSRHFIF
ncbi:hypothetical protein [Burkholderia pyrrocinia]|uniref:hypothetical protein n=1 Tax=Burkholderia pyrrocinia TaxID=60550 RepID=UPI001050D090|nr:hypothetical protein [Burkholderia pyrrocinia]TDA42791.1 hypothetical protein EVG18_35340 [Burkholderia pyrrocinia]